MKERRDCATIKHPKVVFVQKQRQQLRFAVRWGIIYVGLKKSWSSPSPFPPPPPFCWAGEKRGGGRAAAKLWSERGEAAARRTRPSFPPPLPLYILRRVERQREEGEIKEPSSREGR